VLADPDTGLVLGAHVLGPQASNLLQPLVQAMSFGQTAHDVARRQYWIHPALMEVVENLLLRLPEHPR
jgi:mycothione reductase